MGNETTLGIAQIPIRATLDDLDRDLEGARKKIDGSLGDTFKSLGGTVAKIGGAAVLGGITAVVGAVAAIGTAAFGAAMQMDDAYDTIAVGTGKTGDALTGLQNDFKDVFRAVPGDSGAAAAAITGLNRTLGVSGDALTGMAKPLLEATRLLGGDATTNTQLFSRVMGDWGINVADGGKTLDKLFTATQLSGVGMDALMGKVVQFGAPLRLMGFTLEDSISLFAKWEKEGVNAELVMGSLRIAAGKFAKEAENGNEVTTGGVKSLAESAKKLDDLQFALRKAEAAQAGFNSKTKAITVEENARKVANLKDEIGKLSAAMQLGEFQTIKTAGSNKSLRDSLLESFESIKNNTDASAALAQGMEVFGARAGPDMVAAIREGRFAIDDMVAALGTSEGAILKTAAATADWPETWAKIKNTATVALEPLGTALMGIANTVLEKAGPALTGFAEMASTKLVPIIEKGVDVVSMFFEAWQEGGTPLAGIKQLIFDLFGEEALGKATTVLGQVREAWDGLMITMGPWVTWLQANATPVLAGVGAMLAVVLVPAFVSWAIAAGAAAIATLAAIAPLILIGAAVALLAAAWINDWGGIATTLTAFWNDTALPILMAIWTWLSTTIPPVVAALGVWFAAAWVTVSTALITAWDVVQPILLAVYDWFTVTLPAALTGMATWFVVTWATISTGVSTFLTGVLTWFTTTWTAITDWVTTAFNNLVIIFNWAFGLFLSIVKGVLDLILGIFGTSTDQIWVVVSAWLTKTWATLKDTWDTISGFLGTTWDKILGTIEMYVDVIKMRLAFYWVLIESGIRAVWTTISTFFDTTWTTISTAITTTWNTITAFLGATWTTINTAVTTGWNAFMAAIRGVVDMLWVQVIEPPIHMIATLLRSAWETIAGQTAQMWVGLQENISGVVKNLWNNIFERPLSALGTKWEEFWSGIKRFATTLLAGIHISMPHISVQWQDLPVLGRIPSGVSVDWYGRGGEFIANAPMLIGVGELGPERVSIQPVGYGDGGGGNGRSLTLNYYDQRPSGAAPDLVGAARGLEWQAAMRGI